MRSLKWLLLALISPAAFGQVQVQNLPAGSAISGGNYTVCDQSAVTNKCTFTQVFAYINPLITELNGATVPASQSCLGSNASSQLIAGTCTGSGTVTSFAFTNGNGFTGTVSNPTTTPALSLTMSSLSAIPAISAYSFLANATNATASPTAVQASSAVMADIQANTTFTVAGTGCTPSAHTGGPFAGTVTLAATCTALTITMNGASGFTAPNGWHCNVEDRTAMAAGTNWIPAWGESASTTTTATLPIPSAAGATDVISFGCTYF